MERWREDFHQKGKIKAQKGVFYGVLKTLKLLAVM